MPALPGRSGQAGLANPATGLGKSALPGRPGQAGLSRSAWQGPNRNNSNNSRLAGLAGLCRTGRARPALLGWPPVPLAQGGFAGTEHSARGLFRKQLRILCRLPGRNFLNRTLRPGTRTKRPDISMYQEEDQAEIRSRTCFLQLFGWLPGLHQDASSWYQDEAS